MKLAIKHVLTAIILILSLTAPVAAGPHEDARAATGYNAGGFNPYAEGPPPPPGTDLHDIRKKTAIRSRSIRSRYGRVTHRLGAL
jgi:hypothetical protein